MLRNPIRQMLGCFCVNESPQCVELEQEVDSRVMELVSLVWIVLVINGDVAWVVVLLRL